MRVALALVLCSAAALAQESAHPDRLAQISKIQETPGVAWKAGVVDKFASLPPGASKTLNGVKGDWRAAVEAAIQSGKIRRFVSDGELETMEIPESFDSATNWPQCAKVIGDIRDQSMCGCCWAFAGAEAASDRMCIATNASLMFPISAEDVCFCGSDDGCQGGMIDEPWDYIKHNGAVSGGQYKGTGPFGKGFCSDYSLVHCHHHGPQGNDPFPAEGSAGCPEQHSPSCPTTCDVDASEAHRDFASDKYSFSGEVVSASGIRQVQQMIMTGGPVETAFSVYSDFENYVSGVYHHTTGEMAGGHAVKIVGWGTDGGVEYWKVANSWNPYWGEHGYFRIKRGECGIDDQVVGSGHGAKWGRMHPGPAPSPGPSPAPDPSHCADEEGYCAYMKPHDGLCSLLAHKCRKACDCCGASPPSYCEAPSDPAAEAKVREALSQVVV